MKTLALVMIAALALGGCAAANVVRDRVGDRVEGIARAYCDQPASVRAIVRVETNSALEDTASIVVACAGEPGYDELRQHYVEPLSDATINALINRLLTEGAITLPNGTRLKVVVDDEPGS